MYRTTHHIILKKMIKLILNIFLILILTHAVYAEDKDCVSLEHLKQSVDNIIGSDFSLIKNHFFTGIESFSINGNIHYALAEKYNKPQNGKTFFVIILNCNRGEIKKEAKFEFYGDSFDYLKFDPKTQKLNVVFKDSTEQYGWIVKTGSEYKFEMFNDPEL